MQNSYTALSGVYNSLMYDVDYDAWAKYVISLLPEGCRRIGETACGTGNITLRLANKGYRVTASDISQEMLDIAAKSARQYGLKPTFICQDMARLELPPQHAIVCCCDGVNYLTDDSKVSSFFTRAHEALKEGGRLLFDISSEYKLKNTLGNNLFYDDGDDITYIWQNSFNEQTGLVDMTLTIFTRQGGVYTRSDEEHTQKAHNAGHLSKLLFEAGFSEVRVYGFMTQAPPQEKDERIQFIAIK